MTTDPRRRCSPVCYEQEVKDEAMNTFLYAVPKLYVAAGAVSGIAASAAAVAFAKSSSLWNTEAPKELMESLSAALQAAIVKAPHVRSRWLLPDYDAAALWR